MTYSRFKPFLGVLIPLSITISLTLLLQNTVVNNPALLQSWLAQFGTATILVYILIQSLTIIVAPIGGFSAAMAIMALFGPLWGNLIIYFVTTPLYIINFLIAKKFGRRIVRKLVGESGIKVIDKYIQKLNPHTLVIMKIFLGGYFDYISYAAGFSKIKVKDFIIINFLAAIPTTFIQFLIFRLAPNFTTAVGLSLLIPLILGLVYLPFHKKFKKYFKTTTDLIPGEM